MGTKRKGVTPEMRFWSKVDKTADCWNWTAQRDKDGYGQFRLNYRSVGAHRISWSFNHGVIPEGLKILHKCDNPSCVRPDHLFLGTTLDNNRDASEKGRAAFGDRNGTRTKPETRPRGERHPDAKLTETDVHSIRAEHATGTIGQRKLAAKYGVTENAVRQLLHGRTWKHVSCDRCANG